MRTNLFGGAVLGLLCLTATSFAGWDATDKALGHEGKALRSNRAYYAQPAQQVYRAAPVAAPVMSAPVVAAAPAAVPQVATTNSNTERRSFSVEPSAAPVTNNSNAVYSAPRSYNNNVRVHHQPNYSQADTKILGREGN
jgi:hypothetical protein